MSEALHDANDYVVHVFNSLIETAIDSIDGYEKAADLVRNPRFRSLFRDRAQGRQKLVEALKAEVRGFGGEPWDQASFRGRAHRAFLELRDRLGHNSDKPVVEEVERGEDFIGNQFAEAIDDNQLPEKARRMLERARQTLRAEREEISAIRSEFDPDAPNAKPCDSKDGASRPAPRSPTT
jgi:uncharacterized protein (TIGR02284 family)